MKSIKIKYIFFALLIAIAGCRKDEKTDRTVIVDPTGSPTIEVVSGVTGFVTDESNTPVSNATVNVYNQTVTTDENGIFYINNNGLNKLNSKVHVEKSGYFDGFKSFIPAIGKKSFVRIKLVQRGTAPNLLSSEGGIVEMNGGAELSLPPNGVVVKDGNETYNGEISVYAHWYDPTDPDLGISMPGNLLGVTPQGEEIQLGTYGMIAVELESPDGVALQLADDVTATLKFPAPGNLDPPNSIALWSFDESDVVWVQEGVAQLVDGYYIANVSHFSFWNCDAPFPLIVLEGRLLNKEIPVTNFPVTITVDNLISSHGYTDNEGVFRGKVPKGENLTLSLRHCEQTIYSQNIGVFEEDVNLGEIDANLENFVTVVQGRMVGCAFESLQSAYGLLKSGNEIVQVVTPISDGTDADGTFSTVFIGCQNGNYTIQFFDPVKIKKTEIMDITPGIDLHDFRDVRICENLEEFIQYSVDGELAPLITTADVYYSNGEKLIIRGGEDALFESFDIDIFAGEKGEYNPSTVLITGINGPNNPEFQLMCGDHITNQFGCDQFNVTINYFQDFIVGTFSGTLVATIYDSLQTSNPELVEYFVEGSFSVRVDQEITTGEISGELWVDLFPNNRQDDGENLNIQRQTIRLFIVEGSEIRLFPPRLFAYDNAYKFTDLLPGTYLIQINKNNNYEVVLKNVGGETEDCDFEDTGEVFITDELVISSNESIDNIDMGFIVPTSVSLNNIFSFGCSPEITIGLGIVGGLPPYTVNLSDGQTATIETNAFFIVSNEGSYSAEIIDAIGNSISESISVSAYNNEVRGRVWRDKNGGAPNVYDFLDDLLDDILIILYNENGEFIQETVSKNGSYTFMNLAPGNHFIEIGNFSSLELLIQDTNVNFGNDINPETGRSDVFLVGDCNSVTNIDAGFN